MARRLPFEPLDAVLDGLADDLAHPVGDLVVTALRLAGRGGGREVRQVLDELAVAAYADAELRRRVGVARQGPRSAMRAVAGIIGAVVVALVVLADDYLAPDGTPVGQAVLFGVCGYFALAVWWMARMGRVVEVPRFLARRAAP
jgi:hypothetical protein